MYLIGISCLFAALGCLFLAHGGAKKKSLYVCSALLGFLACGANPEVASFVCSWFLLVLLVFFLSAGTEQEKGPGLWDAFPFFLSLCGALINVFSPGCMERNRSTMGDVSYGAADAVIDTLSVWGEEMRQIWHDPLFLTLAVVVFLGCLCFEVRVAREGCLRTPIGVLLVACGVLCSNFLCIFPVVLGYHGEGLSNDRTKYVADLEIRFSLLFVLMYLAQYVLRMLSKQGEERKRAVCLAGISCGFLVCACGFLFLNDRPEELFSGYSFELMKELSNGTVQEVFHLRKEVLETLEAAEDGTDVCLKMPEMPPSRVTYPQGINVDPDYLVNAAVAPLFHLNSVSVEYGAE